MKKEFALTLQKSKVLPLLYRLRPDEIGVVFHWASISQNRQIQDHRPGIAGRKMYRLICETKSVKNQPLTHVDLFGRNQNFLSV
jgi:hypothetical protein